MKRGTSIILSDIDYTIHEVSFYYKTDNSERVFYIDITIGLPPSLSDENIKISLSLDALLEQVGYENKGMAKYLEKVIEGFDDKPDKELLAFKSLKDDNFDLKQMIIFVLNQIEIEAV